MERGRANLAFLGPADLQPFPKGPPRLHICTWPVTRCLLGPFLLSGNKASLVTVSHRTGGGRQGHVHSHPQVKGHRASAGVLGAVHRQNSSRPMGGPRRGGR